MAGKLIYSTYIPYDNKLNYPLIRLQLVIETFGQSTNSNSIPKVLKVVIKLWGLV